MTKAAAAFRTISEVADELDVPKHVLRFWELKFAQLKPMKRGGGRRYYRPEDLELLRGIRTLLHSEGYTIKGVQKILREQGVEVVKAIETQRTSGTKRKRTKRGVVSHGELGARDGRSVRKLTVSPKGRGTPAPVSFGLSNDVVQKALDELESCRDLLTTTLGRARSSAKRKRRSLAVSS